MSIFTFVGLYVICSLIFGLVSILVGYIYSISQNQEGNKEVVYKSAFFFLVVLISMMVATMALNPEKFGYERTTIKEVNYGINE